MLTSPTRWWYGRVAGATPCFISTPLAQHAEEGPLDEEVDVSKGTPKVEAITHM